MANNIAKTVLKAENYVDQGKKNIEQARDYKTSWHILPSFMRRAKPKTNEGS